MKVIVINQKVAFARHWFKWYRVQRAGEDWRPLAIGKPYVKPKTIEQIAKDLEKGHKRLTQQKS